MRQLFVIVLVFLVVTACKRKNSEVVHTETETKEIPLWVNYTANDESKGKSIVLVSGDEEYRSEEALPQLAKILSQHHGYDCTVLFAQDPDRPGLIDPNYRFNIPGLHLLEKADLVIWFTRFRELPEEQMQHLESYLKKGKPVLAIRTATHAFDFENKDHAFAHYGWDYQGEKEGWHLGFGKRILGETWYIHHGNHARQSTRGIIPETAMGHPILNGVENGAIWGATDVYGIRMPLGDTAEILVLGKSIDRAGVYDERDIFYGMRETDTVASIKSGPKGKTYNPNEKMPPIAWLNTYALKNGKPGRSMTSTIGAAADLLDDEVRRLLVNSSYHLLDLEVPEFANVTFVGEYDPNQFGFYDDAHWKTLNLRVADFIKK